MDPVESRINTRLSRTFESSRSNGSMDGDVHPFSFPLPLNADTTKPTSSSVVNKIMAEVPSQADNAGRGRGGGRGGRGRGGRGGRGRGRGRGGRGGRGRGRGHDNTEAKDSSGNVADDNLNEQVANLSIEGKGRNKIQEKGDGKNKKKNKKGKGNEKGIEGKNEKKGGPNDNTKNEGKNESKGGSKGGKNSKKTGKQSNAKVEGSNQSRGNGKTNDKGKEKKSDRKVDGKNTGGSKSKKPSNKSISPGKPSIPPNQSQQTSDINYGKGQSIIVFHVAEKPSIAQAIAKGLAKGDITFKKKTMPVHEFINPPFPKAPYAKKVTHKVGSVAGHVFSVDFPQQFQSWESVDPAELFHAPVVRKPCKGSVVKYLQDEAKGADFIVLWMDCDRYVSLWPIAKEMPDTNHFFFLYSQGR